MKIGLLTLPVGLGYGGIMQAFALKTALTQLGHEVIVIRRIGKKHKLKRIIRRTIKKYVFWKKDTIIFIDRKNEIEYPIVTKNIQPFIDNYLKPFSPTYLTSSEFKNINSLGLDTIVVGSDQVWRPDFVAKIEDYFLYGIDNRIKRYAYAASFGVSTWIYTNKQTKRCKNAAQKFIAISVREKSGVDLCKQHLNVDSILVLDPTLLFDGNFYMSYVKEHDQAKEHKICAYILDRSSDKMSVLDNLSKSLHKDYFFAASENENEEAPLEKRIAPSIEEWLDSFFSSDCVFTDSFHGCAFAIIFRKPFYVYINKERGAERFYSLAKLLGLEQCIISENTNLSDIPRIDWVKVEKNLSKMRDISNNFLSQIK